MQLMVKVSSWVEVFTRGTLMLILDYIKYPMGASVSRTVAAEKESMMVEDASFAAI